jgi:uncharacterized protein (TIGR01777 family)
VTYLLTGATGFIGRHLVAHLLAGGHSVNYLGRRRSPQLDSRAAFHVWNPSAPLSLASVPRIDTVVNLMGEPIAQRWSAEVKRRIYTSRVVGTRQLVSAIAELSHKPSALISSSAIGFYGDRGDEILTEASSAGSGFLAEVSRDWETEALHARKSGLRVVTIRTAAVLGRDGGALPKMLTPFRLGLGAKFGKGRHWMSWIHIQDLIRLYVFAAETRELNCPLNGSSPQPVTNAEFTRALARALSRPAFLSVPKPVLRLGLGEMAEVLFDSLRVVPEAPQQAGFSFDYPTVSAAFAVLF